MVKYHNDTSLVQELIKAKLASGAWKYHPEFAGNDET